MVLQDCFGLTAHTRRKEMNTTSARINLIRTSALLLALAGVAAAADQPGISAVLFPEKDRKPAPSFALQDATGKTVKMEDYRGKVVLLDFWATCCTGCKKEIPWVSEFQTTHGEKGFAVVGISLDEDRGQGL